MKKFLLLSMLLTAGLQGTIPNAYETIPDRSELEILTPSLSQRQTTKIRLRNGLQAYLISDPGIEQSAAALSVETGSWNDPEEYPGMAHFLEHMLFMGTEAYPEETDYWQFILDHGGKVNAYTASDRTVYMFSVNNHGFFGALDRFSHFFIDPLFKQGCINRELHAVDQEHAKNIENDPWRHFMILKETGNQSHPFAKFSTGNAKTLGGIPQSAMKAWYKEHYTANKMHLVVLSSLPMDQLVEATVKDFSQIGAGSNRPQAYPPHIFTENLKGHLLYIKPVKDLKILSIAWELPRELALDRDCQVGKLLGYVLANGNKNSLLAQLKRDHLAEAIQVSEDPLSPMNKFFVVDILLTDKGVEQVNSVILAFFETLARVKKTGIPRYIFNEVERIEQIEYQYQARKDAFEYACDLAAQLVYEELATFPRKTLLPTKYDPQLIAQFLSVLTPEQGVFSLIADPSKTQVTPNREEKWMGAEYKIVPIGEKQLSTWAQAAINPQIGLPQPNLFIPKNLTLLQTTYSDQLIVPSLIQEDDLGKIYFSEDRRYLTPKVAHLFRIKSPELDGSARAKALSDLTIKAIQDTLFPITSAAQVAGSTVLIKPDHLSLIVAVDGYSDTSSKLLEEVFIGMKKTRPTREQFDLYKQSLISYYENQSKELPFIQSLELLSSILFKDSPLNIEKLEVAKKITYEEYLEFSSALFKKNYLEGLLYGNITRSDGEALATTLKKKFQGEGYPLAQHHQREVFVLPDGQGPYMLAQSTSMLGNAAVLMIEQGGYTFEKRGAQQILGIALRQGFFDTLRTKQQTAYIAKAWEKEEERQLLQFFAVQSSTHQPNDLIARFELFLENFVKEYTTEIPPERFENLRKMAIKTLEMPPENLFLMASSLFQLGFDYDGDFHLVSKRVKGLESLTYEQTEQVAQETLSRKNSKRIAILVEGTTPKEKEFRYELTTRENLLNQGTFVAWK